MAIRARNLDLSTDQMKRTAAVNLGVIPVGTSNLNAWVAPAACVVDQIDFYPRNGISANTSDTFKIHAYIEGASGSNNLLQAFAANTSAATNTFSANSRLRLTPSANNSLSVGTLISIQVSSVCQAVLSQTICIVSYTPLIHRESR
jgi:hypothetical protein